MGNITPHLHVSVHQFVMVGEDGEYETDWRSDR